jgi:hypothetical protein
LIVTDRRWITNAILLFAQPQSVFAESAPLQIEQNGSNTGDFLFREFRIDGKRQAMLTQFLRHRKVA